MTTLERAARALCLRDGADPDGLIAYAEAGHSTAVKEWAKYQSQARAVLQAIREPDMAQVSAAVAKAEKVGPHDHVGIYRAMIDATLNE